MENLPKRDDDIYKEIEAFEDYELTQCVAYEMAVRNKYEEPVGVEEYEFIQRNKEQEQSYKLSDINLYGFFTLAEKVTDFYPTYINDTKKNALNIFKNKLEFQEMDEKLLSYMFNQGKKTHIQNIANDLSYFIDNFLMDDNKQFVPQILPLLNGSIKIDKARLIDQIKHTNISKQCLILKFSRPRISPPTLKEISLDLNIGLPLDELIAQITKIKKMYNNNNEIVKTPLELLGNETQKETLSKKLPKKPNAEKYADMFFIYDYITARYKDIKQYNTLQKEEYEAELLVIQNNKDLTTQQKRELKKDASKHYKEMKSDATLRDICYEDELTEQLDIQGEMIYKYYNAIKPFIEDMKYKELITGISEK